MSRRFFETIPDSCDDIIPDRSADTNDEPTTSADAICNYIRQDLAKNQVVFKGPFGPRKVVYCDYTASGRSVPSIEHYIADEVLPLYGNTHSSTTVTAQQTTLFRQEAREVVRAHVGASDRDAVLFVGAGATAAVNTLAHAMRLEETAPVIIHGPFEHHSNLLPWRELAHKMICVPEDEYGMLDVGALEDILVEVHADVELSTRPLVGCFTAASNVTGVLTSVDTVTALLHAHGATAIWDYASAAPYAPIEMNPAKNPQACKDAVFFSGHKFVGGPQSPGVLVVKKDLLKNSVPYTSGGGTVFFVKPNDHQYLKEAEFREEGGSPDSIGAIRLALAIKLKNALPSGHVLERHRRILRYVANKWKDVPNLTLLGPQLDSTSVGSDYRLATVSFVVGEPVTGRLLHHNAVCAMLDNIFGIQSRAGCLCAGPYVQQLLGINLELADRFESVLREDTTLDRHHLRRKHEYSQYEMLRPGVVRMNLSFYSSREELDFVTDAVALLARKGWKLLPQYRINPETGEWHHVNQPVFRDRKWLGRVSFDGNGINYPSPTSAESAPSYRECIDCAAELFANATSAAAKANCPDGETMLDESAKKLRWFLFSSEAQACLLGKLTPYKAPAVFTPRVYKVRPLVDVDENGTDIDNEYVDPVVFALGDKEPDPMSVVEDAVPLSNGDATATDLSDVALCSSTPCADGDGDAKQKEDWSRCHIIHRREDAAVSRLRSCHKWHSPPARLFKAFLEAVNEFAMIRNGDRVLVCLSGGKDSLSLLHTMHQYQFYARKEQGIDFELGAITVDPGSSAYDPSPLIGYLTDLNITYLYEEQRILDQALSIDQLASICSFCSRMKRGRLYASARRHRWNVLAFGQHLDDLAESFLISAFYTSALRTMKAHYTVTEGDLRVIRPLCFVREKWLRDFAEGNGLPIIAENCPACFEAPKERHRIKQLLATQEVLCPNLFNSLRSALRPIMAVNTPNTASMNAQATQNILQMDQAQNFDGEPF